jgi:hypothetical protein
MRTVRIVLGWITLLSMAVMIPGSSGLGQSTGGQIAASPYRACPPAHEQGPARSASARQWLRLPPHCASLHTHAHSHERQLDVAERCIQEVVGGRSI